MLESVHDDFVSRDDLYQFLSQEMPRFTAERMAKALNETNPKDAENSQLWRDLCLIMYIYLYIDCSKYR